MKLGCCYLVTSLMAFLLAFPCAQAKDQRPVVAVFDIQVKRVKLSKSLKKLLTELMAEELAVSGFYQVSNFLRKEGMFYGKK